MRPCAFFLFAAIAFPQAIDNPANPTDNPNQINVTTGYLYLAKMHYAGAWSSTVAYNSQDLAVYSSVPYISLVTANLNNTPSSSPSQWFPLPGSGGGGTWGSITGTLSAQTDLESALNGKQASLGYTAENAANKDVASGYAGLTAGTLLKAAEMPALTGDCTTSAGAVAVSCGSAIARTGADINTSNQVTVTHLASALAINQGGTGTASGAAQNSVFAGPASGGAGAPSFQTGPTISAANMTGFPTFNQSTTGNAATATALASTPSLCSTGQAPTGILASGNATGCAPTGAAGWDVCIDFRNTSGYVVDPANCVAETATAANYPQGYTTGSGVAFNAGWETSGVTTANRTASGDPRIAGMAYCTNDGTGKTYRIDLPSTGYYEVWLSFSDQAGNSQVISALLKNTSATVATVTGTTNNYGVIDATAKGWPNSGSGGSSQALSAGGYFGVGVSVGVNFTTTILRLQIGATNISGTSTLNSIGVRKVT